MGLGRWALAASLMGSSLAFYLPGVAPLDLLEGEFVEIKSIKLTSVKTQLPFEYYSLPFCEPESKKVMHENLGEKLRGDRIQHTPYKVSSHNNGDTGASARIRLMSSRYFSKSKPRPWCRSRPCGMYHASSCAKRRTRPTRSSSLPSASRRGTWPTGMVRWGPSPSTVH